MSITIRTAFADDLERLATFAVAAQADPERFSAFPGEDATLIAADVAEFEDWPTRTYVALDDDRHIIGWLLVDTDAEMGRLWLWGPFLAGTAPADDLAADALLGAAIAAFPECHEHELAADEQSGFLRRFADRHGFGADEGSVILRYALGDAVTGGVPDADISPVDPADAADVVALHDELFPGTHTTGSLLVSNADERRRRWAARRDGLLLGYVATEVQNDGSVYIDYLGVAADVRREGLGRRLIRHALHIGADATYAHLTVRVGNVAARGLYASVGFVEERIVVPYRRGFSLP